MKSLDYKTGYISPKSQGDSCNVNYDPSFLEDPRTIYRIRVPKRKKVHKPGDELPHHVKKAVNFVLIGGLSLTAVFSGLIPVAEGGEYLSIGENISNSGANDLGYSHNLDLAKADPIYKGGEKDLDPTPNDKDLLADQLQEPAREFTPQHTYALLMAGDDYHANTSSTASFYETYGWYDHDIQLWHDALIEQGVPEDHVIVLSNHYIQDYPTLHLDPEITHPLTLEGLKNAYNDLKQSLSGEDLFLFMYSGHGGGGDISPVSKVAIKDKSLASMLNGLPYAQAVVGIRSCNSGSLIDPIISYGENKDRVLIFSSCNAEESGKQLNVNGTINASKLSDFQVRSYCSIHSELLNRLFSSGHATKEDFENSIKEAVGFLANDDSLGKNHPMIYDNNPQQDIILLSPAS